MEKSSDVQPRFFFTFFAMLKISEIKDDLQVISQFPCLLQTPCRFQLGSDLLEYLFICLWRHTINNSCNFT